MNNRFTALRTELIDYYKNRLPVLYESCIAACQKALDEKMPAGLTAMEEKGAQCGIIAETLTPILFENTAFFYETATNQAHEMPCTPGMWTYRKNLPRYREFGKKWLQEKNDCASYPIYTYCGEFGDELYHFAYDNQTVLEKGYAGIVRELDAFLDQTLTEEQRRFYQACRDCAMAMKRVAERFSALAGEKSAKETDPIKKANYRKVADTAAKIPWEKPDTLYEALETVLFIQQVVPALESAILNTVGRLDILLQPFYEADLKAGRITEEEAYRLISEFLILFDCRIDHDLPEQGDSMVGAVYTLGGCDEEGKPVFNDMTRLFLQANSEENIIYPKIKCRYNASSPEDYLELINRDVLKGKSTVLYVNDDSLIPAFIRAGIDRKDARDYSLLGCWEPVIPGCSNEHCAYMSLIRILELSVYGGFEKEGYQIQIKSIEKAESFEEVLEITLANIRSAMSARCRIANETRGYWKEIDPHPLYSLAREDCLRKGKDLTDGGTRYYLDEIVLSGLSNLINSLLVIKELCFEKKKYTLKALLETVRHNWDQGIMRAEALKCHYYGDESEISGSLVRHVTDAVSAYAESLETLWPGKVTVGYMLFMELYRWAPKLRATPDGRHDGDLFERGLTPSSLHPIKAATSVLNTLKAIDPTGIAADSVLNLTLPFGNLPPEVLEQFLRAAAGTAAQSIQINCVSREELEDAIVNPEAHRNIVVRVCGYSAPFVTLPDYVQKDFLQRNFYEN